MTHMADSVSPSIERHRATGAALGFALGLVASLGCSSDDRATADASDAPADASAIDAMPAAPAVHFVGRYDDGDPNAVRFSWPGSGAVVRFDGTGARVRLDDPAGYFTVVVDGAVQARLETTPGERVYELAASLPAGEHTVELYRRTEGAFGPTVLLDVELDGSLLAPRPPARRIEILGDSITCGYGNEGADQFCNFSADTENHYLTYGAIAARSLGAELSTVAWSGKGVIYNYGDDTFEPLPEVYERAIPTDSAVTWSFDWQPNVVVINLGTNDFSTDNDPTEQVFVAAYAGLLEQIRQHYPSAAILCSVAPSLGNPDQATALGYIDLAIAQRATAGDANVKRVDLSAPSSGWGCDWHPSVATHQAMAAQLESVLHDELDW